MTELIFLALYVTVFQIAGAVMIVMMGLKIDRQTRALELMLRTPPDPRPDLDEIRRRARAVLRGGGDDEKEERGTPPLILDDEYEAALEERTMKARDDG